MKCLIYIPIHIKTSLCFLALCTCSVLSIPLFTSHSMLVHEAAEFTHHDARREHTIQVACWLPISMCLSYSWVLFHVAPTITLGSIRSYLQGSVKAGQELLGRKVKDKRCRATCPARTRSTTTTCTTRGYLSECCCPGRHSKLVHLSFLRFKCETPCICCSDVLHLSLR